MKHTKGNWRTQDILAHDRYGIYSDDDEFIGVAFYQTSYNKPHNQAKEEGNANAKLMAAAPELLNALELCRKWFEEHGKDYEIGAPNCFIQAKSAINKAKGELNHAHTAL